MKENKTPRALPLLSLLAAVLVFGTVGLVRREIPLGSGTVALFRGAVGALVLILGLILRRNRAPLSMIRRRLWPLALSGAAIGINWILLFEAFGRTTVAAATLAYYMAPVFAILASAILFHERISPRRAVCLIASLVGIVLVSGVGEGGANAVGVLFGLGAALFYASVIVANRRLSDVPAYARTLVQLLFAALVVLPYVLLFEDVTAAFALPFSSLALLLLLCVVHTGIAYVLYFFAVGKLSTVTVGLIGYLDPIVAVLLSALVLRETMSLLGMIGAAIVILAAVVGELPGRHRDETEARPYPFRPFRRQWIFPIFKPIFYLFFRRPQVVNLSGEFLLPSRAILVANHFAKRGPMAYELYLPTYYRPWGAYQMLGSYKMRFHYLRDVFYMQKRGFGVVRASILATFEAVFSMMIYRGMRVLPSYPDARFVKTLHQSIATLEAGMSVLVFPEDSSEGYHDVLRSFHPGFVALAEHYLRKNGEDLPVYPIYYNEGERRLIIGPPSFVGKLLAEGKSREEIAQHLCESVNALYTPKEKEVE